MPSLHTDLESLGIIQRDRLQPFYPRVRDRDDIAVLRDPFTEVIVLSGSEHMSVDYYQSKQEDIAHQVHEHRIVSPVLEDDVRRAAEFGALLRGKRWLDFGCGLGGVLDAMKGQTTWAAGLEPSLARASISRAKGHVIFDQLEQVEPCSLDIITLFHVFEHLTTPLQTLIALREHLRPGGTVLIEVPHARDALFNLYDCDPFKRFTFWSEHLILHTRQSLKALFQQAGYEHIEVIGKQRYPLSNHLYWLTHHKPGGHDAWVFLNSTALHAEYEAALARMDQTDTLIAFARAPGQS